MAYVQAFLDDNPLTQGLAKLQGKIKPGKSALSTMAAGTMGGATPRALRPSPASPFARRRFCRIDGPGQVHGRGPRGNAPLSETTGVAVEKLAAMPTPPAGRRFQRGHGKRPKRMQSKEFQSMFQGIGKGGGMKGLTAGTVASLGTGDATNKLGNSSRSRRTCHGREDRFGQAARFRELLPLISQGVDHWTPSPPGPSSWAW